MGPNYSDLYKGLATSLYKFQDNRLMFIHCSIAHLTYVTAQYTPYKIKPYVLLKPERRYDVPFHGFLRSTIYIRLQIVTVES